MPPEERPHKEMYARNIKYPTPEEMAENNAFLLESLARAEEGRMTIQQHRAINIPKLDVTPISPADTGPSSFFDESAESDRILFPSLPLSIQKSGLYPRPKYEEPEVEDGISETTTLDSGQAIVISEETPEHRTERIRSIFDIKPEEGKEQQPMGLSEKSFYTGLNLGGFTRDRVGANQIPRIKYYKQTRNEGLRELIRTTIGSRGEILESDRSIYVYLDALGFTFLEQEKIGRELTSLKQQFAPFVMGFIMGGVSEKEHRISLRNEEVLERVAAAYSKHYGQDLLRTRRETNKRRPNGYVPVIEIKDFKRVMSTLLKEPTVRELPFFEDLKRLAETKYS